MDLHNADPLVLLFPVREGTRTQSVYQFLPSLIYQKKLIRKIKIFVEDIAIELLVDSKNYCYAEVMRIKIGDYV